MQNSAWIIQSRIFYVTYYFEQKWVHSQDLFNTPTTRPQLTQTILSEEAAMEDTMDDDRVAAFGKENDVFMVSEIWWKASALDDRDLLRRLRFRANAKLQSLNEHPGGGQKEQMKNHKEDVVAKVQAHLATSNHTCVDVEDSDDDSVVLQMQDIQDRVRDVFDGMVRVERWEEVRCRLEDFDRIAYSTKTPSLFCPI
jgi:hypothetical protein